MGTSVKVAKVTSVLDLTTFSVEKVVDTLWCVLVLASFCVSSSCFSLTVANFGHCPQQYSVARHLSMCCNDIHISSIVTILGPSALWSLVDLSPL